MIKVFGQWAELKKLMDVRIEDAFDEGVIGSNARSEYYQLTEEIGRRIAKSNKVAYHDRMTLKDDKKLSRKARGLITRLKNWLKQKGIPTSPDATALAAK